MSAESLWDFCKEKNVIKGDGVVFPAFVLILLVRQEVFFEVLSIKHIRMGPQYIYFKACHKCLVTKNSSWSALGFVMNYRGFSIYIISSRSALVDLPREKKKKLPHK